MKYTVTTIIRFDWLSYLNLLYPNPDKPELNIED
jgi:hypothetical protein